MKAKGEFMSLRVIIRRDLPAIVWNQTMTGMTVMKISGSAVSEDDGVYILNGPHFDGTDIVWKDKDGHQIHLTNVLLLKRLASYEKSAVED